MSDPHPGWASRWFWPLAGLLLVSLAIVQVTSVRHETETWDEGMELASGYAYLETGQFRINREHPPLAKILAALPLLPLHPDLPLNHPSWRTRDQRTFASEFLYRNRVPADAIVFRARLPMVAVTIALGFAIALWTRGIFGAAPALLALLLFVFDPNITAHGRYVKNDIAVTLATFLFCVAWGAFLLRPSWRRLVLSGALLGVAIATKFTAVFLLPVMILLSALRWKERGWTGLAAASAACVVAFLTVAAVYAPEARALIPMPRAERVKNAGLVPLRNAIDQTTTVGRTLAAVGTKFGWREHSLFTGFADFAAHSHAGHESYLLGMHSETGWWYYLPAAFILKTPAATLLALAFSAALGIQSLRAHPRSPRFEILLLAAPVLVYLPLAMSSRADIGLRHLLPIYPYVFILAAVALSRVRPRILVAAIAAGLVAESVAIYPHYLAFFNFLTGGPGQGPRYLVDSNLDWGQDLKNLKTYLEANRIPRVCLTYFGTAPPEYYGVPYEAVDDWSKVERGETPCDYIAVSATPLEGVYVPLERFAFLRRRAPIAKVGYSIYVYSRVNEPGALRFCCGRKYQLSSAVTSAPKSHAVRDRKDDAKRDADPQQEETQ